MITITIAITDDKNIIVKTDPQANAEPKKKVGRPKKAAPTYKEIEAKKYQKLAEMANVTLTPVDDDSDCPFEVV